MLRRTWAWESYGAPTAQEGSTRSNSLPGFTHTHTRMRAAHTCSPRCRFCSRDLTMSNRSLWRKNRFKPVNTVSGHRYRSRCLSGQARRGTRVTVSVTWSHVEPTTAGPLAGQQEAPPRRPSSVGNNRMKVARRSGTRRLSTFL